jgi:hypothetical protein
MPVAFGKAISAALICSHGKTLKVLISESDKTNQAYKFICIGKERSLGTMPTERLLNRGELP